MASSIIGWLLLIFYQIWIVFVHFVFGVNWKTVRTKYHCYPIIVYAVLFYLNKFFIETYTINTPAWFKAICFIINFAFLYLGFQFSCIGLTGGIASGKKTVCKILEEIGYEIIDTDYIYKQLDKDSGFQIELRRAFGPEVFTEEG